MKIVRFTAENFKRLSLVEITPTGEVVELLGRNGQGKSSVLDAIDVAIRGLEVAPRKPIKTGAEEARIRLDLGELIVTRTFKRKDDGDMTTSLRVESADGVKKASPQTLLDSMIGALAFDPLEFERMDVRRQFDALRAFVPGVDFDEIARLNREDFERRTAVNRKAKDAKVSAERIRPAQPDENLGMIDTAALIEKLDEPGSTTPRSRAARLTASACEVRSRRWRPEVDSERCRSSPTCEATDRRRHASACRTLKEFSARSRRGSTPLASFRADRHDRIRTRSRRRGREQEQRASR
jgi:hypothetical protein